MEALTKTRRIGGSLVATIPKIVVDEESLVEDQVILIQVHKLPRSGFGISTGKSSFSRADKLRGQLEE